MSPTNQIKPLNFVVLVLHLIFQSIYTTKKPQLIIAVNFAYHLKFFS